MNTAILKTFAPAVRRQLMEAVNRKLDFVLSAQTPDYLSTFAPQVAALRKAARADRDGLVERVAYTWFNRLAALRYLDARGWHPFRCRVLTTASSDETQPEILKLVRSAALPAELQQHINPARLNDLIDGRIPSSDPQGEVYRHLVLASCRYYHALLPDLFERLDDETELLLPDDVLTEHSVVQGFRTQITDTDCAEVEVLGWLYQFYISEKKDEVMARKSTVPSEDIPAVTQLFTPHWIVRYLVENSLGRLWLLNRPNSRLREKMPYYIEGQSETDFLRITGPEEIRVLDPAVGSGHMLTYAFDLLYAIYEEEGYAPSDIPKLILTHNLYGLDICPRAAQLASLALALKARERSSRALLVEHLVQANILALQDVRFETGEIEEYSRVLDVAKSFNYAVVTAFRDFEDVASLGSLLQPRLQLESVRQVRRVVDAAAIDGQLFIRDTHSKVIQVIKQTEYLATRYHVVVANPPYFGPKQMNAALKEFAKGYFPDSKTDLYAMFMERSFSLALDHGYSAMIVMQSWMFLHSFQALRTKLLTTKTILSMAHLGPRAFSTITGEVVTVAATCFANAANSQSFATFCRLVAGGEAEKELGFRNGTARYVGVLQKSFRDVPGSPIAYWISNRLRAAFKKTLLFEITISDGQNITANNARFVREHWEVSASKVGRERKWLPYAKGGPFRRWFGNIESVIDWSEPARVHYRSDSSCRIIPEYLWYCQGVTWSRVGTGLQGFRLLPADTTFDKVGSSIFPAGNTSVEFLLGVLNSPVTQIVLDLLNPSIDLQVKDVRNVPLPANVNPELVERLVGELISHSQADWSMHETSLDFHSLAFLRGPSGSSTLRSGWENWKARADAAVLQAQDLETKNNRLIIDGYGLADEISPEVPADQITLTRADRHKDMAALLSYAVGCMMGRYSLDLSGLVLANAGDGLEQYTTKVGKPLDQISFVPDSDGVVPVLDGEWFEDDVVARTREFLCVTFGESTFRENLRFLEESLGKDLRKYFLTDFYKDHLQTYKKRPIYWMVQSPRKGFSVLIYLHRYTRDTMNIVLNRYLREFQAKLRSRIAQLSQVAANESANTRDKTAARKESDRLVKTLRECEEWERETLLPLAQARIELDLDDGVKLNYLKLGEALAPIPGLAAKDED